MNIKLRKTIDVVLIGLAVVTFGVFAVASCAAAAEDSLPIAPLDVTTLIEKIGGWGVVVVLLAKIIFNDLAHLKEEMVKTNSLLRVLVKLQAESMGKNPDMIEALSALEQTSPNQ